MLALLYDVHGNLGALDAVLADARAQGASSYLLGGDFTLFGPFPAETLSRLRELANAQWLRGNGERWTAQPEAAPAIDVVQDAISQCRAELGAADVDALAALPELIQLGDTLACHGSPVSDVRSFAPEACDDEAQLLAGVTAKRLIFGHTHLPLRRRSAGGIELVNPGSVGMPFDGDPRAAYALIAPAGEVAHRRVVYDHLAAAAALRERYDGAWTAVVAARIEQARLDAA